MEKNTVLHAVKAADILSLVETDSWVLKEKLDETGWIVRNNIETINNGMSIKIIKEESEELLACAQIALADKTNLSNILQMPESAFSNSILINSVWVSPRYTKANLLPAILYLALRRGRILQRKHVVGLVRNLEGSFVTSLKLKELGKTFIHELTPVTQALDYAMYQCFHQCHGEALLGLKKYFMTEVQETVDRWIKQFFRGSWAQAILNETITKEQYIATLCHWHQFVRQTTQHIARAVVNADNRELRNHYIYHFKGEINHELLIENDLKHFDYDLDFLLNFQVPAEATKEFMAVQESTIGFYQDPIRLLACPLAAEGMTASVTPEFLAALYRRIASWGIENPKNAARFISSHVHTDGGEEGHWARVLTMIGKYIGDEKDLQQFLSVLNVAMHTYERAHNANIDNYKLWTK